VSTRTEPAYRTVAEDLRERIRRQEFAGGRQMPTESELSEQHGLSRQTVRRAFQVLVAEGLVERTPRRGTFAVEDGRRYIRQFGTVDELMGLSIDTEMVVTVPLHRTVDLNAASRLRLTSDAVHQLSFHRIHDGVAFCTTTVYLPPDVGAGLDQADLKVAGQRTAATVIGLIEQTASIHISEAEQSMTAVSADKDLASQLVTSVGSPLLRVDRLYYSRQGNAVELAISHFLPGHYSYRVRLRRAGS